MAFQTEESKTPSKDSRSPSAKLVTQNRLRNIGQQIVNNSKTILERDFSPITRDMGFGVRNNSNDTPQLYSSKNVENPSELKRPMSPNGKLPPINLSAAK